MRDDTNRRDFKVNKNNQINHKRRGAVPVSGQGYVITVIMCFESATSREIAFSFAHTQHSPTIIHCSLGNGQIERRKNLEIPQNGTVQYGNVIFFNFSDGNGHRKGRGEHNFGSFGAEKENRGGSHDETGRCLHVGLPCNS